MSVHSRPSMKYQDGMELRDRKMTKDCTHPLRIENIRALNGCAELCESMGTISCHSNQSSYPTGTKNANIRSPNI